MTIEIDIYLNQLGQRIEPSDKGLLWFQQQPEELQVNILNRFSYFILQMGGTNQNSEEAVKLSGLKETYTPCVLLLKSASVLGRSSFVSSLSKMLSLPKSERQKVFLLTLSLFFVVDRNKREKGVFPDKYWWHRDLSNKETVTQIIKEHSTN